MKKGLRRVRKTVRLAHRRYTRWYVRHGLVMRMLSAGMAILVVGVLLSDIRVARRVDSLYDVERFGSVLIGRSAAVYADRLKSDNKGGFRYNDGYVPGEGVAGDVAVPRFTADFAAAPDYLVTINDPQLQTGLSFKPAFAVSAPQKSENRVVYPIAARNASLVYTMRAASVKEDIILYRAGADTQRFTFELQLPSSQEARLEVDGSLGVYGVDNALLGQVSTGSDADAELLEKARQNGAKTKLVFRIPAPFVVEPGKKLSQTAKAHFELEGNRLTVVGTNLKAAKYPLSIDPSVYIETAAKLMRGNNETNTDFDVDNELIQKSQTTGARIDQWTGTTNLTNAVFGQGTAVAGGYIYSAGGIGAGSTVSVAYNTAGNDTFVVPAGITSITVKAWGGGGGGGNGSGGAGRGGNGGGGGHAKAVLSVTPAETLDIRVGYGGNDGSVSSGGGDGGGHSAVLRSGTYLVQAGGGGGGGGSRGNANGDGGNGGAGGGGTAADGISGENNTNSRGRGGSTTCTGNPCDGGTAGTGGTAGATGVANAGGDAGGSGGTTGSGVCNTSVAGVSGNGNALGGGEGGDDSTSCSNGGGGGSGRFGGGGGASRSNNNSGGGGGGGGSSLVTGTNTFEETGSGQTPGGNDGDRNGAGDGGAGGTTTTGGTPGDPGRVLITYIIPGTVTNDVYWAKFNTSTNAIESPNPGTGACTGWCTNSVYDLPAALTGLSLVAYNGYLFALGGSTDVGTAGTPQTTVYIAKLGANGEPQLWHPTGGTPVYWYTDTALTNARAYFGAVAYNNRLYILGGLTGSSTVLSSNTVQYADIRPMGTLTAFTSTGMQALSSNRWGVTAQVYNDTVYVLGGATTLTGAPVQTVEFARLNSDGTMNAWQTTSTMLTTGRVTNGGSFSTSIGGYMYITGGCTTVNASGYCTAIASDVQIASINADGSLSEWNTITTLTNDRFAHTMIAWQGGLYRLGGCRAQDTGTGVCTNGAADVDYGSISPAGEVSTVSISEAVGAGTCTGGSPYNCNLPPAGDDAGEGGHMLSMSAINNGYIYVVGGCIDYDCNGSDPAGDDSNVSGNISYSSIGSDGRLSLPTGCSSSYGNWCVDSTNRINGTTGVAAAGVVVFNSRIYIVGGINGASTVGNIYRNSFNANGSLAGAWSSQSLSSVGIGENIFYTYVYARANPADAATYPGNLYVLGGCGTYTGGAGCGSSDYETEVYKCWIEDTGEIEATADSTSFDCTTSGQLQIDAELEDETDEGLGIHSGTVYANYIYLIGGFSPAVGDRDTVFYAKFDDSNNIVDAVSGLASGNDEDWILSGNTLSVGRRRGWAFGYNGHIYTVGGFDDSGGGQILPFIEWAKMNVSDGSIDPFQTSSIEINQRWGLSMVVSNSYAYVIGGCDNGDSPGDCDSFEDQVQVFQLYNNDSGAISNFTAMSDDDFATDANRWGASAAIYNGYIYVAGGCTSNTDCTAATADVQYASISAANGTIGTWTNASNDLPDDRAWGSLEVAGGYLYYLGGLEYAPSADEKSDVFYVGSFSSGNISAAWSTASGGIGDTASQAAQDRARFASAVWNNRIYVLGGLDDAGADSNTVYISPQLNSGGNMASDSWTSDADVFDVARSGLAATAYANNLYIFGGYDGANYLNDAQFTQINSDGTVDAWVFTTSLPGGISDARAVSSNGYIYLIGGRSAAASCAPNVLITPISANTTIATGNNPTGTGEWYETNTRYGGGRYGAAIAFEDGKLYTVGGGCSSPLGPNYTTGTITQTGTTVTGAGGASWNDNFIGATITYADASTATVVSVNSATQLTVSASKTIASAQSYTLSNIRSYYSTVKSQPQVAIYSRMIDTDTDVFPTDWLMNGLDNSIGARWQMRYRSMHDTNSATDTVNGTLQQNPNEDCGTSATMAAMTTWGQETNYGDVTLGTPDVYTPKNSGGSNINCARYFYFFISIDASKTFGYPEDVNRGPTINDLSLFFTADPSKRLRHGKTFTGGELQPLDTPF